MSADNVIHLGPVAALNDIPGQLRDMADRIERGEIIAESALFIIPEESDWPRIYGWGDHLGDYGNIAVLDLAKTWFIHNLTARKA
jgi:hypothetical protein